MLERDALRAGRRRRCRRRTSRRHAEPPPRDVGQRLLVVERAAEHPARLDEEPLPLLGELAVLDVGRGADPAVTGRLVAQRTSGRDASDRYRRGGAAGTPSRRRAARREPLPALAASRGGRRDGRPRQRRLASRQPGELVPALVEVRDVCRPRLPSRRSAASPRRACGSAPHSRARPRRAPPRREPSRSPDLGLLQSSMKTATLERRTPGRTASAGSRRRPPSSRGRRAVRPSRSRSGR